MGMEETPFHPLYLFTFTEGLDYPLIAVGTLSVIVSGALIPSMTLLWGAMIDDFDARTGFF